MKPKRGSVLLEFVLAAPILLALVFLCLQVSHVWVARLVTQYAAYSAARTAVTAHPSEYVQAGQQAAEQVCAWVVMGHPMGSTEKTIPGWGSIPGTGAIADKTKVTMERVGDYNIRATVEFDFGLIFPIAGPMLAWSADPHARGQEWQAQHADSTGNRHLNRDAVGYPHMRLTETAIISKPFHTLYPTGVPAGGW